MELASVSSRWHSLVMSSPRLWNTLSDILRPGMVKLAIQNSRGATLDITLGARSESWLRKKVVPSLISCAKPLMAQWKSLTLHSISDEVKESLVCQELPWLETLILVSHNCYATARPTLPLNIRAPHLKQLTATGHSYPLQIEPGLHSNLTVLHCTPRINGAPFLPEDYRIILSSAPYLEEIDLSDYGNSNITNSPSFTPFNIRLPHLRVLDIDCLSYTVIGILLSSIITAPDRHTSININGKPFGDFSDLFLLTPTKHSLAERISRSSRWLDVRIGVRVYIGEILEEGLSIESGVEDKCLLSMSLWWDKSVSGHALMSLIQAGWFSSVNKLKIRGLHFFHNSLVATHLHLFSKIETLQIGSIDEEDDSHYGDLEHVLQTIASPLPPTHPFGILPELRHIIVDTGPFDLNYLIELVKNRTPSMDTEHNSRTRLETIIVADDWDEEDSLREALLQVLLERGVKLIVPDYELW
ncbi:hypothetical protein FRC03_004934 [Tulasnella sp. 419]|nr:hypothetical protein FRC03_004934 [Tulasnella sp. 419]